MDKIDNPPSKYSYMTRVGNWFEETELLETKMKDHIYSKNIDNLKSLKLEFKKDMSNRKTKLTRSTNNIISNNSTIGIYSKETNSLLSSYLNIQLNKIDLSFNCYFSKNLIATNRGVFKLVLKEQIYPENPEVIKYGDKFYLETVDGLLPRNLKLYLSSKTTSHNSYAKISKKQEVIVQREKSYNCIWEFEYIDYKDRILYKGEPIDISKPLLLKHSLTGNWLSSNKNYLDVNSYGKEYEAYCYSHLIHNKPQKLNNEKIGLTTIDNATKNQMSNNEFLIITSDNNTDILKNYDENEENFDKCKLVDIIYNIWVILKDKGTYGKRCLRLMFNKVGSETNNLISKIDTKWCFRNVGILLENDELDMLFSSFLKNNLFNYNLFLDNLKGYDFNKERRENVQFLVNKIFNKENYILIDDLKNWINLNKHPDYCSGIKIKTEIELELYEMLNKEEGEKISKVEFEEYLQDISACIETDKYYEALILFILI